MITQLKTSATEHVAYEENRLFPLLADALQELGKKVRMTKETAPTRAP